MLFLDRVPVQVPSILCIIVTTTVQSTGVWRYSTYHTGVQTTSSMVVNNRSRKTASMYGASIALYLYLYEHVAVVYRTMSNVAEPQRNLALGRVSCTDRVAVRSPQLPCPAMFLWTNWPYHHSPMRNASYRETTSPRPVTSCAISLLCAG